MTENEFKWTGARLFASLVAAAVFLTVPKSSAATDQADPAKSQECGLKAIASIDLVGPQGIWVPVTINSKPALMVWVIGSGASYMFAESAERLGLQLKKGPGIARTMRLTKVNEMHIANLVYKEVEMMVAPGKVPIEDFENVPVIGAFGMDLLNNVDFEIDLARRKLNLFSTDHCPGKVVYWTDAYASAPLLKGSVGNYYFPMELDGQLIETSFEAQAPSSSLTTDVTKQLYDFDENTEGNEKVVGPTGNTFYYYRAMQLTAPGLAISNAKIRLDQPRAKCPIVKNRSGSKAAGYHESCQGTVPLQLGYTVMQKLRIYIATKEMRIYYSSADAVRQTAK